MPRPDSGDERAHDGPRDDEPGAGGGGGDGDARTPGGAAGASRDDAAGSSRSTDPLRTEVSGDASSGEPVELGTTMGRYTLTRVLGAGGMGVVFAARDPELAREVAVKVLLGPLAEPGSERQAKMRHEGQVMARLTHPNVLRVYDVGFDHGRAFVAMEYVAGGTLERWLAAAPRAPEEIVAAFTQAGQGLAAAHQAGLVHRDFKPSNVLVSEDGRVMVTDFGVARAADAPAAADAAATAPLAETISQTAGHAGTPAFMAPEQHRGEPVSARADQFSFCVALWQALYGAPPYPGTTRAELLAAFELGVRPPPAPRTTAPAAVRAALERGLSVNPAARFASMDELLRQLTPPARPNRSWVPMAVALLVVAIGFAYAQRAARTSPCTGGAEELAALWDPRTRERVAEAFRATGLSYAAESFAGVESSLQRWRTRWTRGHRAACEASLVHHEQSGALLDRRMRCLLTAKAEMAALLEVLMHADRAAVDRALQATADTDAIEQCARPLLATGSPDPRDATKRAEAESLRQGLAQLAALRKLGHWKEGLALGRELVQRARRLEHLPTLAQVLTAESSLELTADGELDTAIAQLYEAARLGSIAKDDRLVASALDNVLFAMGSKKRNAEAAEVAYHAAAAAVARLGDPLDFVAELTLYRGYALSRSGDYAGALTLRKHLVDLEVKLHGPESYQVANALGQAASAQSQSGHAGEARPLFERALTIAEKAIGPHHPNFAALLHNAAGNLRALGDTSGAAALFERALAIRTESAPPDSPPVASAMHSLAEARFEQRRLDEARTLVEKALAIRTGSLGAEDVVVADSLELLAAILRLQGKPDDAHQLYQRAIAIERKRLGEAHPSLAGSLREDAATLIEAGHLVEAKATLDQAMAMDTKTIGDDHPDHGDTLATAGDLLCAQGHCERAVELFRQAVALHEKEVGPQSAILVPALTGLCEAQLSAGELSSAIAAGERALALASADTPDLRGAAESCLARAQWELGADRATARARALRVRDQLAASPLASRALPALERWLASHR